MEHVAAFFNIVRSKSSPRLETPAVMCHVLVERNCTRISCRNMQDRCLAGENTRVNLPEETKAYLENEIKSLKGQGCKVGYSLGGEFIVYDDCAESVRLINSLLEKELHSHPDL